MLDLGGGSLYLEGETFPCAIFLPTHILDCFWGEGDNPNEINVGNPEGKPGGNRAKFISFCHEFSESLPLP